MLVNGSGAGKLGYISVLGRVLEFQSAIDRVFDYHTDLSVINCTGLGWFQSAIHRVFDSMAGSGLVARRRAELPCERSAP